MRIHELAKELGVPSKDILASLEEMGYEGRTASSTVPDEAVPRIRAAGGRVKPGVKPRTATADQLPTRRPEAREVPGPEEGNGHVEPETAAAVAEQVAAEGATAPEPEQEAAAPAPPSPGVKVPRGATPQELADRFGTSAAEIVKVLFQAGEMVSITQSLSDEAIDLVAGSLGTAVEIVRPDAEVEEEPEEEVDESRLQPRPPVVTVMGHVDHGKTLLLDAIRETDVVAGEFGGITQHIGAYQAHHDGRVITFIDTPGHEAFTAMRARGAEMTDVAVLVVAADDGVMPQTIEALDHARAAGVPIVVAVNKVDKPESDPQRVRQQLVERGVVPAEWGGDYEFVDVSAKTRENLDKLLETILLVADLEAQPKADPTAPARGSIVEAHLDRGRGPIASVLVQRGTLRVGDAIIAGGAWAKVRAMLDEHGDAVKEAGPSKPVQVLGWSHVPEAGDDFRVVSDEREARHVAQERETRLRAAELATSRTGTSLADLLTQARQGELPALNLIIKADVQGSLEAITDALEKLPQDEVRIDIVHRGVGGITENDVTLALASSAVIIGFNVRPDVGARELAEKEGVDIRLYQVIYRALDEIRQALSGLLAPEEREVELGRAEVRQLFRTPRGVVAGCMVTHGTMARGSLARLVRDGVIVYTGRIGSLRRFKDDVREVAEGFECGIALENYQDVHEGDVIEAFEVREIARTLQ